MVLSCEITCQKFGDSLCGEIRRMKNWTWKLFFWLWFCQIWTRQTFDNLTTKDRPRLKPNSPCPAGVGGQWNYKNHWIFLTVNYSKEDSMIFMIIDLSTSAEELLWKNRPKGLCSIQKQSTLRGFKWRFMVIATVRPTIYLNVEPTNIFWHSTKRLSYFQKVERISKFSLFMSGYGKLAL